MAIKEYIKGKKEAFGKFVKKQRVAQTKRDEEYFKSQEVAAKKKEERIKQSDIRLKEQVASLRSKAKKEKEAFKLIEEREKLKAERSKYGKIARAKRGIKTAKKVVHSVGTLKGVGGYQDVIGYEFAPKHIGGVKGQSGLGSFGLDRKSKSKGIGLPSTSKKSSNMLGSLGVKDIAGFTGAGLLLGAGTAVSSKAGFDTSGLSAASEMMSPLGTVMMGGNVIRMVGNLPKPKKKGRGVF